MLSNQHEDDKGYRIERLSADHLHHLDELYHTVYDKPAPEGYFLKKYDTAYTGRQYTGYLALNDKGIAIAYYGVTPCYIQYDRKKVLAAQSVDTMTHPQYRYKGMFAELSKNCFDLCRRLGIAFIFGFPNQNFYKAAVNKWGWQTSDTMECFIIPVRTLPLAALSQRIGWLKALYQKYARRLLDRSSLPLRGLPHSAAEEGYGGILRDEAYLNYKSYSDTRVIQAGAAKAWVRIQDGLVIGDLALEGQELAPTIGALKKIAARLGIRRIFFQCSPGTRLHGLFKTHYKAIPSFPVIIQDLGAGQTMQDPDAGMTDPHPGAGLSFDKIKFTFADIDIF